MFGLFKRNKIEGIDVNAIGGLDEGTNLIDIREKYEYDGGSVKGAKNIPMGTLLANPENYMNKEETYYIMCQSGNRSARTCMELKSKGYNVVNVTGGYGSYRG